MRLSDHMSAAGLALYPTVALIIFLVVFVAVLWRVLSPRNRDEFRRAASLPLDDASTAHSSLLTAHSTPRDRP
jgi:cbb3-type cytochrome oxidase subunit 3